jgi:hypothetical protein
MDHGLKVYTVINLGAALLCIILTLLAHPW